MQNPQEVEEVGRSEVREQKAAIRAGRAGSKDWRTGSKDEQMAVISHSVPSDDGEVQKLPSCLQCYGNY